MEKSRKDLWVGVCGDVTVDPLSNLSVRFQNLSTWQSHTDKGA